MYRTENMKTDKSEKEQKIEQGNKDKEEYNKEQEQDGSSLFLL